MEDVVYDQHARLERDHWWFRGRRRILSAILEQWLPPCRPVRSILDVGTGTGGMLAMLAEFGSVRGLDMSPKAVAYCQERLGDSVQVRVGRVPEDLTPADVVTAFDVIEHLDHDIEALGRIHQALPAGGVFVCTVPAFPFLWSGHDVVNHHYRRYTRRLLGDRLQAAGFSVERLTYFNTILFPAVAVARLVGRNPVEAPRSDMTSPPSWVNELLCWLFASERFVLRSASFPVGVSLLAVCTKPEAGQRSAAVPGSQRMR